MHDEELTGLGTDNFITTMDSDRGEQPAREGCFGCSTWVSRQLDARTGIVTVEISVGLRRCLRANTSQTFGLPITADDNQVLIL